MQRDIQYAIAALGLSETEVTAIVKESTGIIVDPTSTNFLQRLDQSQLKAVWKRLSDHPKWKKPTNGL